MNRSLSQGLDIDYWNSFVEKDEEKITLLPVISNNLRSLHLTGSNPDPIKKKRSWFEQI